MKRLIQLNLLLLLISSATAQESPTQNPPKILRAYDWKDLNVQSANTNCQIRIISMDGISVLKIENTNNAPLEVTILKIVNSSIIKKADSISWEMKYENVESKPYIPAPDERFVGGMKGARWFSSLNLLEHIPSPALGGDERTKTNKFYFSETSNWKRFDFTLNRAASQDSLTLERALRANNSIFNPTAGQDSPSQLELKLSFIGNGTAYLRPIKLLGITGSWWSPQQIGLIGGIGGSVIGCFGALLGCLAGMGKARNFVLTTMKIFIALGILLTIGGFVAVVSSQPYAVWYALLLPGVILTLVFSLTLPSIQRRYDELEIRRMTSVDTMGS
jgi:hypothetical protein